MAQGVDEVKDAVVKEQLLMTLQEDVRVWVTERKPRKLDNRTSSFSRCVSLTVHPQVLVHGVVTQTIGHGTAQLTPDPKAIPRRGPTTTETATETTTDPTLHARQMEVDRSAYLTTPNPTDLTLLRHQNVSNATRRVTTGQDG